MRPDSRLCEHQPVGGLLLLLDPARERRHGTSSRIGLGNEVKQGIAYEISMNGVAMASYTDLIIL